MNGVWTDFEAQALRQRLYTYINIIIKDPKFNFTESSLSALTVDDPDVRAHTSVCCWYRCRMQSHW